MLRDMLLLPMLRAAPLKFELPKFELPKLRDDMLLPMRLDMPLMLLPMLRLDPPMLPRDIPPEPPLPALATSVMLALVAMAITTVSSLLKALFIASPASD
jgi:hypothetical protein